MPRPTATTLSDRTLAEYKSCTAKAAQWGFKTPEDMLHGQARLVELANGMGNSASRVKTYLCAFIWAIKGANSNADCSVLSDAITELFKETKVKEENQTLPEEKLREFVAWKDVLKGMFKAHELFGGLNPRYILYLLYTIQPPVRCDYRDMRVFGTEAEARAYLEANKDKNACVHNRKETQFYFQSYKTQAKYGLVITKANGFLHTELAKYLPGREYLLPYTSSVSMSQAVKKTFGLVLGKDMTVNLLRHSFITDFMSTPQTLASRRYVAQQMLHSTALQELYQVLPSGDSSP